MAAPHRRGAAELRQRGERGALWEPTGSGSLHRRMGPHASDHIASSADARPILQDNRGKDTAEYV